MKLRTEGAGISLGIVIFMLVISAGLVFLERKVDPRKPYDERQDHARGVAGQWGFLTMAVFNLTAWLIMEIFETEFTADLALRMSVYLGITVFCSIAIWKDAYVALTESYAKVMLTLGLLAAYRWMRFFDKLDSFTFALRDTECWTDLGGAVVFTWLAGLLAVKFLLQKRAEQTDE